MPEITKIGSIETTSILYCTASMRFICLDKLEEAILDAFIAGASIEEVLSTQSSLANVPISKSVSTLWSVYTDSIQTSSKASFVDKPPILEDWLLVDDAEKFTDHLEVDCGSATITLHANRGAAFSIFPIVEEFYTTQLGTQKHSIVGQIYLTELTNGNILKSVNAPTYATPELVGPPDNIFVDLCADMTEIASGSIGLTGVFHAATLLRKNKALMLCNPSGSGKSTLAWLLTSAGFTLLHDDVLPIDEDGSLIQLRTPATIKSGSWDVLENAGIEFNHRTFGRNGVNVRFQPIASVNRSLAGLNRNVLFVTYDPDRPAKLTAVPPQDSFSRLVSEECVVRDRSVENLERLVSWIADCRHAELRYNDSDEAVELINNWLGELS